MKIELNPKQLSYIKGLDSKKKQRKFLLDCILENIIGESQKPIKIRPIIFKDGAFTTNDKDEIAFLKRMLPSETFKEDHEILMQKMEESKGKIRKLKESNLSSNQIEAVLEYLSGFEQLKGSVIPIRFKEDSVAEKSELDKQIEYINESKLPKWKFEEEYIDNENHLCWIYNRLIGHGENPNFDYMIKLKEIALNYSEPKQEVEEKVDLSKELYLTCYNGAVARVLDYSNKKGLGIYEGDFIEQSNFSWIDYPNSWCKSTPEEIKSMLIKKLEADGLKVGCKAIREWADPKKNEKIITVKRIEYYYDSYYDTLECGGRTVYEKGKFAKIIPQEEVKEEPKNESRFTLNYETFQKVNNPQEGKLYKYEFATYKKLSKEDIDKVCELFSKFKSNESAQSNQTENNELVNSSNEIKDIIVVDFENVSQKENPQ